MPELAGCKSGERKFIGAAAAVVGVLLAVVVGVLLAVVVVVVSGAILEGGKMRTGRVGD